jgi:hypothetical protein
MKKIKKQDVIEMRLNIITLNSEGSLPRKWYFRWSLNWKRAKHVKSWEKRVEVETTANKKSGRAVSRCFLWETQERPEGLRCGENRWKWICREKRGWIHRPAAGCSFFLGRSTWDPKISANVQAKCFKWSFPVNYHYWVRAVHPKDFKCLQW